MRIMFMKSFWMYIGRGKSITNEQYSNNLEVKHILKILTGHIKKRWAMTIRFYAHLILSKGTIINLTN